MRTAIADLETNGLLDTVDKIHCIVIHDLDENVTHSYHDNKDDMMPWESEIKNGIEKMMEFDRIVFHNGVGYDVPVLKKLFGIDLNSKCYDTLVMSRLIWTNINEITPGIMGYSLAAWGKRLGENKGEVETDWQEWSREMQTYCEQDVKVTTKLYLKIVEKAYNNVTKNLEHRVAQIIHQQEQVGFGFNEDKAQELYGILCAKRHALKEELKEIFQPQYVPVTEFIPKVTRGTYTEGRPLTKIKLMEFNPLSRIQIVSRLRQKYDWTPADYTEKGNAKVDESILAKLEFPEAKKLVPLFTIQKRLGQLAEGTAGWLRLVGADGRMHGRINTNGAVTGRMTHYHPNIAQVPASNKPYGKECRALFRAGEGKTLVGVDASALEMRCLAGYCYRYDNGAMIEMVTSDGIDMHQLNADMMETSREGAKAAFYAFIYGAGMKKLGDMLGKDAGSVKASLEAGFPALMQLSKDVKSRYRELGYLKGLDGRLLHCRSEHSSVNTLLQSAGAVAMKAALVILYDKASAVFGEHGVKWQLVANVHDEWQIECDEEIADKIGMLGAEAIKQAGKQFNFPCPLAGDYKIGYNWSMTH